MSGPRPWVVGASTLGAPDVPLASVLRWLEEVGARGIELRATDGQPVSTASSGPQRRVIRAQLAEAGMEFVSVCSYVRLADPRPDVEVLGELVAHLQLAAEVGASHLRVFPAGDGDSAGGGTTEDADRRIVDRLVAAAGAAGDHGVRIGVETHGARPRGADVERVLAALDEQLPGHGVGAIWDVEHPVVAGEEPEQTWEALARRLLDGVGYVQLKDSTALVSPTPALVGAGVLPLERVLRALETGGYAGPLSLEWERAWFPGIEDLPTAMRAMVSWLEERPDR